jgi:hypothetical protein
MIRRYEIVQDFFPEARTLRDRFEAHFSTPYLDTDAHAIWNFWHVPEQYTFLRTWPDRFLPAELIERFTQHLSAWTLEHLGIVGLTRPEMHLYVEGCAQELHTDYHRGFWGYVFSLTPWDERCFNGGETVLFRDGAPNHKRHQIHGTELAEVIPARFNQLLVFNDSIVHGVRRLNGTVSPRRGRVVLTGHIVPTHPVVRGGLDPSQVRSWWLTRLAQLNPELEAYRDVHGLIAYAVSVTDSGSVAAVTLKSHTLVSSTLNEASVTAVAQLTQRFLERSRFPAAAEPSTVTVAMLVPTPNLNPVRVERSHSATEEAVRQRVQQAFEKFGAEGRWAENSWHLTLRDPDCSGSVVVDSHRVRLQLEVPPMRPSHRSGFEAQVGRVVDEALEGSLP